MRIGFALPYVENEVRRRCGTCVHYQIAPLAGQGWCRNRELRSEHERALVNRNDHRCAAMIDDFWEPTPVSDKPRTGKPGLGSVMTAIGLPPIRKQLAYALLFSLILLVSAVGLFSTSVLSTPVISPQPKASLSADAKHEFWLRDDATSAHPSVIYVMAGSKLELIDSKAGDILDPTLPSPAKWYRLRVTSSGDIGWAYSGWIERH
ncbi:MAG: hypothetical protein Q7O66_03200 [Dehalococcoidia bacterium]|nr:hypothetical protein [Dehalococcoidia bacterium]